MNTLSKIQFILCIVCIVLGVFWFAYYFAVDDLTTRNLIISISWFLIGLLNLITYILQEKQKLRLDFLDKQHQHYQALFNSLAEPTNQISNEDY